MVAQLASQIDDTRLAVGGEAMQEATQTYNYVKAAAKTTPGLKPVADQLGERFPKASAPKPPAPPAAYRESSVEFPCFTDEAPDLIRDLRNLTRQAQ